MFVMDYYGHKLSNGVLFAHHLILDVPGGSSHLGYRLLLDCREDRSNGLDLSGNRESGPRLHYS